MVKHTPKPWTCTPGRDYCSQFDYSLGCWGDLPEVRNA